MMNQAIFDFLTRENIGVLSVLREDGTIHSASIHFSHQAEPLKFYIQTSNTTLKAQPFLGGKSGYGALVVGFSEEDWITVQMSGNVRAVTDPAELERAYNVHYGKFPKSEKYKGPDTVLLEFSPTWWRYTDFNTDPETIVSSYDAV